MCRPPRRAPYSPAAACSSWHSPPPHPAPLSPLSDQAEGDLRDARRDRAGAGAGDGRRALRQVRPARLGTNLTPMVGGRMRMEGADAHHGFGG